MKPLKLKENFSKTSKAHTAPLSLAFCLVILPFPLLSGEFGGKLRGKHETRGCVATTTVQPLPYDCFHGVTWKLFTAVENNYRSVDVQPTAECAVGKWSKLIWAACFGLIWQSLQTLQVILYFTLVKGKYGCCWCQQKKAWQFSAALRSHRYGLVQNNTSVVRISTGVVLENPQSPLWPEASWKGWKDSSIHCWNLHCCKQVGTHAQTQICKKESKKQNEQIEIVFRREFWSTTCPNADWPWVGYRVLSSQGTGCLGGVVRHGVIRLSLVNASHLYFIWFLRTATPDISTGMNSGVTISYPAGVCIWQLQQGIQVLLYNVLAVCKPVAFAFSHFSGLLTWGSPIAAAIIAVAAFHKTRQHPSIAMQAICPGCSLKVWIGFSSWPDSCSGQIWYAAYQHISWPGV